MNVYPSFPSTFSIVARDPETGDLGIAVQSKFIAVGAVVPWAKTGVGAIATQSYANTAYGPQGLARLAAGLSAQETLDQLVAEDEGRALRQAGIVDAQGRAAAFTGEDCYEWAGHRTGQGYCCQGNILQSAETVAAMAETFEQVGGPLAERLLAALAAGQAAGGDRRGQQSAALLVVREGGGYAGFNDHMVDLRVDDHPSPIDELIRLYDLYRLYFLKSPPEDLLPLEGALVREVQQALKRLGYYGEALTGVYDEATQQALWQYVGTENLEERWQEDAKIDPLVLDHLRRHSKEIGD